MILSYVLPDEAATMQLGASLAACLVSPCNIYLEGDLGAGKTTLVRATLRAMGHEGSVKSPTYTLVESYELALGEVVHMDLYRLADPEELEYIGIRDLLDGSRICLIEWPDKGQGVLPQADLQIQLKYLNNGREIILEAHTVAGESLINCLKLHHTANTLV